MKKILLFSLTVIFYNKHFAQIEKGTRVPGISINGNYNNSPSKDSVSHSDFKSWRAGFTGSYGVFIKQNLLLKYSLGYSYSSSKSSNGSRDFYYLENSNLQNLSTISAGLSLSKYKFLTENFAVMFGPSVSFLYQDGNNKYKSYNQNIDANANIYYTPQSLNTYQNSITAQANLSAGISYFVSKNLAITGNLGFLSVAYSTSPYLKSKKQIEQNNVSVSLTPSFNAFNVGLTYYIRTKTKQN